MANLSAQLEPYKQGAIEYLRSCWCFNYLNESDDLVVVEPNFFGTSAEVYNSSEMMDMLCDVINRNAEMDEWDEFLGYVHFCDMVHQLSREELLKGIINQTAIRELDARYSYSLHLLERIEKELGVMDVSDIYCFAQRFECMSVDPATGKVEFEELYPSTQYNCDSFETKDFVSCGCDFNDPERNIFCGHQFREVPIWQVTREDYLYHIDNIDISPMIIGH